MNRAYSVLEIKSYDEDKRKFKGIASTPSTDRSGDVVDPKGAKFTLPIPLLWQHNANDPIGLVTSATVTEKGIEVEGEIAYIQEEGELKNRLKTAWQMIKNKLVRGLSIGFNPIDYEQIKGTYGLRFKTWDWLELSAVTIPANQDATIMAIKSIDKSVLSALGKQNTKSKSVPSVIGSKSIGTIMKTLQELRDERTIKSARMEELLAADEMNDDEQVEFDALESEVKELDKEIRIKRFEYLNGSTAKPVNGKSTEQAAKSRANTLVKTQQKDDDFEGQSYTRLVIAKALANLDGVSASGIANQRWAKSNPMIAQILKANEVAGGGSGSGEWGAELVTADNRYTGDFIEFLYSMTVFDRLALRSVPANIQIKGRDGQATGYWVGESRAIPATTTDFSNVSLTPLKVAALAVVSNELLRDSSPSAERLVRDALVEASAQRVDGTFFSDAAAVAGVSPAGILNGLTALTSAGTDGTALRNDVKALYRSFITAKNASGLAFVTNPAQAKAISLLVNALGQYEFPQLNAGGGTLLGDPVFTGDNVEGGHLILLKPSDIYKIGDGGVQVSISREATIAQNSAPVGRTDTPVGETQAWNNMFQTESTAIKVVRSINWAKRRDSAVAYIRNIDYDGVES